VTSACNSAASAAKTGFADALDVFGINYHSKQYDDFKGRVLVASETSSALSTRGEYALSPDKNGDLQIDVRKDFQCTSYDLDKPGWGSTGERDLLDLKKAPWVAGEFVWTGFDYIGEPTPYKWPSRSSYFGIVDLAGFPKDRFYLYQSQWTNKPVLHLLPHWNWAGLEGKAIPVWAFTNADSVELFLNGKSQGVRDWKENKTLHLEWKIPYAAGTLKAVGKKDGKIVSTDEVFTAGPAAKLELQADRSTIHPDGNDLSYVTLRVLDKDNHVCPDAGQEVVFHIEGPATIAGVDNGDPTNHEPFKASQHKAFHGLGLAIVQAKDVAGNVTLKAESKGLEPVSIDIHVAP
jgi:beta-galactosidase